MLDYRILSWKTTVKGLLFTVRSTLYVFFPRWITYRDGGSVSSCKWYLEVGIYITGFVSLYAWSSSSMLRSIVNRSLFATRSALYFDSKPSLRTFLAIVLLRFRQYVFLLNLELLREDVHYLVQNEQDGEQNVKL